MLLKNPEKSHFKYICESCNYNTSIKKDFNKHLLTAKHKMLINANKNPTKIPYGEKYICSCGKAYTHTTSLYRHKNKCEYEYTKQYSNEPTDKELIIMLLKQNSQLIEQNNDLTKNGITLNSHNNTNSHNKTFNLQFFLNETCKDAMNIMDFVDSIKLQVSDLENVGKLGYVEGISNIITSNLKALDITKRPVHCADKKREVMYVKDEDKWEKDEDNNKKLRKAIKRVVFKNQMLLPKFREQHPDCTTYHSKFSDQYNKIIVESMGGSGDNDKEKEEKIIRNISKHVIIEK